MTELLRGVIGERKKGHIFSKPNGKPWDSDYLGHIFYRLKKKLGLPEKACVYCVRHGFASHDLNQRRRRRPMLPSCSATPTWRPCSGSISTRTPTRAPGGRGGHASAKIGGFRPLSLHLDLDALEESLQVFLADQDLARAGPAGPRAGAGRGLPPPGHRPATG